ncbi:unnamed protein product [Ranitomeya imitator]|uniref:Chromo domain-containing protein n=1 Tax=Ranitomeya imitator TaxID=111125 RepID=A0ABN9LHU3_9NEOB|nr:unnamed protein product [Ranitomeya imitator]
MVPSVEPPAPVLVEGELEYIVEKILDSRVSRRKLQYLVKWKGYAQEDNSWVFASDVHAPDLVRAFHVAHPGRPGGSGEGSVTPPQGGGTVVNSVAEFTPVVTSGTAASELPPSGVLGDTPYVPPWSTSQHRAPSWADAQGDTPYVPPRSTSQHQTSKTIEVGAPPSLGDARQQTQCSRIHPSATALAAGLPSSSSWAGGQHQASATAGARVPPSGDTRPASDNGIVPKKEPGKYRLIHHLSYPKGASVNDAIPVEESSVTYSSFDRAVELVRAAGPGALLAKSDIVSLPPFARCLPMGCSISCHYFELFSTFLDWVLRYKTGSNSTIHYLDDFLFVGPGDSRLCSFLLQKFKFLTVKFGVPLSPDKTFRPL